MTRLTADPYVVLGVARDADEQQVRDAYRALAKRHHPDLHPDEATSARMGRVNAAWDLLSDPVRRARYDAEHPRRGSTGAWGPTWADVGTGTHAATGRRASGWRASPWTPPARRQPPATPAIGPSSGPPWAILLVILVVGWLAIGGVLGGFPLPLILGLVLVAAVGSLLSRFDR